MPAHPCYGHRKVIPPPTAPQTHGFGRYPDREENRAQDHRGHRLRIYHRAWLVDGRIALARMMPVGRCRRRFENFLAGSRSECLLNDSRTVQLAEVHALNALLNCLLPQTWVVLSAVAGIVGFAARACR